MAGGGLYADPEAIQICRTNLGLEQPMIIQFWDFISGFVTFDLGTSMWTGKAITYEIALRFELSLQVAIMATLTAVLIAIPLGTISAVKQNTWIDYFVRAFSIAGIAIPSFWLGIMIILGLLIFTQAWFGTPWMPPIEYTPIWVDPWANLSQLIWPAVATGWRYSAVATRMTRSALLEVLREDYIRTARAKGLPEWRVILKHVFRNSLIPLITLFAGLLPGLIAGSIIVEYIFSIHGMGSLAMLALSSRDYPLMMALFTIGAMLTLLGILISDLLYAAVDPRISLE
ncbi:MAG: ABC transporter permease [Hyphomicrobiaceae bacterium]|nr:ABC transporter permease [Hyphomicrobiaceae bacterium]